MTHENEPAFPKTAVVWQSETTGRQVGEEGQRGMSLRDWFAGQIFGCVLIDAESYTHAAELAYEAADALISERNKQT